ncbi:MAG TPA: hypothetical protein VK662_07760 [Acidothermaceae bacterium]|jgi:hypothetical protein|nr:hypothetical protein [Acidothermaceae bacterium]
MAASATAVASAEPIGDPDAIQKCLPYRVNQIAPEMLVAGYDTTLGFGTRYLDALGNGPSQPADAQRDSTTPVSLCVFDGSFDTPDFQATRVYVMVGAGNASLYPSVFNDDTGLPDRPGGTIPAPSPSAVATWSVPPGTPMLPSVDCPTTYGIANPGSPGPVTLLPDPPDANERMATYTDALHNIAVIGPAGWSCHAVDAADGNVSIMVTPPGVPSDSMSQPFIRDTREGIHAFIASAGTGSVPDLICAVMPDLVAATWNGRPCPEKPATETVIRDNPVAAEFYDPPGVVGDGAPSGGSYQAVGRMLDDPAHGGQPEGAASVTCTLPRQAVGTVCDDVVVEFAPYGGGFYPIPGG